MCFCMCSYKWNILISASAILDFLEVMCHLRISKFFVNETKVFRKIKNYGDKQHLQKDL